MSLICGVPKTGDYIVIFETIDYKTTTDEYQSIAIYNRDEKQGVKFIGHAKLELKPGEWYQIKSIHMPQIRNNTVRSNYLQLSLGLEISKPDRRWARKKVDNTVHGQYSGHKDVLNFYSKSRSFLISSYDLNNKAMICETEAEVTELLSQFMTKESTRTRWQTLEL